ncbi:hypothetical protein [Xinzhou nematode virus 6]|uniref:Uncharacterized protein n=1 Tax=Xinzhou nematode virus 6 TaxID=1923774 RepID=A0A1L3KIX2_9NIDO|nr:hypothetical protein [Xinzhou nematode virus 6]APG77350.1 hypothetical protein [Xinzhou nematode virus 6]
MSQQVTIPLSDLIQQSQRTRRRRQRRTRRQLPKNNLASKQIQQLAQSVAKLEGAVQKVLQPKQEVKQKFFLLKRPDEKQPTFIIPPSDKKDCRRKMGQESINVLAEEIKKSIKGGGGDIVYNDGALHCHIEILAPGHDHPDLDEMLSSLNISNSSKGATSSA